MSIAKTVVIVNMECLQAAAKSAYHISRAIARALHFRVSYIKARNQIRIVYHVNVSNEVLGK